MPEEEDDLSGVGSLSQRSSIGRGGQGDMAGFVDGAREFGREALGRVRNAAGERVDQAFEEGFNEAANLCVRVVAEAAAPLTAKMATEALTEREQAQLARLTILKDEIERALYGFWDQPAPT